jgi:chromosome partitioning protein
VDLISRFTDPLVSKVARARSKALVEAAMASAALAASACGPVTFAKRLMLDQVLDSADMLRGTDPRDAVGMFDDFVDGLREQPERVRARAFTALSAISGNREAAAALVQIARAVAGADGAIAPAARAEIAQVAGALGVPVPADLDTSGAAPASRRLPCSVVVVGNEKGGTGKSTTAMHLIVALLAQGRDVGSVDLDGHQGTLSRYLANRQAYARKTGRRVPLPTHRRLAANGARDRDQARAAERSELEAALGELDACDVVIVDTPGSNAHLTRLGHTYADVLVTPLNDSFLDIDVLARIDRERREVLEPSPYACMVRDVSAQRAARGQAPVDWIVMRNRLAHIDARNTREMAGLLRQLSGRMGFRLHPGLSERVVFRELFYRGLTLLDDDGVPADRVPDSLARARAEVEDLVAVLRLEDAARASAAPADQATLRAV